MIRSINFRVTEKKVEPANKQWLGMQREDNATDIVFDISGMPGFRDYDWRIDLDNASAGYSAGAQVEIGEGFKVSRLLSYSMTRFGGDVQITLVGSKEGEIVYSIPVKGYLTAVAQNETSEDKSAVDITAAEVSAKDAAAKALEAAEKAETAAEDAEESQALTELARRALEAGSEFVFLGGDASGAAKVELVVDEELSEFSRNPVENRKVFENFSKIDADLKEYISAAFEDFKGDFTGKILDKVYPVGSIYISESATDPETLFGGVWKRLRNTFILAAGYEDEKFPMGSSGEADEVTLKVENMPKHVHKLSDITITTASGSVGPEYQFTANKNWGTNSVGRFSVAKGTDYTVMGANIAADDYEKNKDIVAKDQTTAAGNGEPFSIMPPYVTRYVWQRTA